MHIAAEPSMYQYTFYCLKSSLVTAGGTVHQMHRAPSIDLMIGRV